MANMRGFRDFWERMLPCDYTAADQGMLQIFVGDPAKKFLVHQAPFAAHSKFISATLQSPWKESLDKTFRFPEEDVESFSTIIDHIYGASIRMSVTKDPVIAIRSYLLADKLRMDDLMAKLMHGMRGWFRQDLLDVFISGQILPEEIPIQTALYRYLVDLFGFVIARRFPVNNPGRIESVPQAYQDFFDQDTDFVRSVIHRANEFDNWLSMYSVANACVEGPQIYGNWPDDYDDTMPSYIGTLRHWFARYGNTATTRSSTISVSKRIGGSQFKRPRGGR